MSDHAADRHRRVSELFLGAAELSGDARAQWLDDRCGSDGALRAEVEALLAHDAADEGFLGSSPMENVAASLAATFTSDRAARPARIGRYRILDVLGEGGMGVVYRAEQDQPKRPVALKVLRGGMVTQSILRRFEREAQTLGRLHHRGIARIYDAGTFDPGSGPQPYFAMELIEGMPLTQFIARRKPALPMLVTLLIRICEAVEHAHRRGVVHRDLKPGNIMIVESDAPCGIGSGTSGGDYPQPVILDFGIARITDSDRQATTIHTDVGQLIGTLPYMSPEQVSGDSDAIDARSDVYALGVIGYEMFAGRPPLALHNKPIHEAVRIIREDDPPLLSTIDRTYRGDLQTILGKAMEKDRSRRYPSAAAFAEDVRRFLNDEPIVARPASAIYQLRKFARRNRALVTGASLAIVALIAGIIASGTMLARTLTALETAREREADALVARDAERRQRAIAEQHQRELQKVIDFQAEMIASIDPESVGSSIMQLVRNAAMEAESSNVLQEDGSWPFRDTAAATDLARGILDEHLLEPIAASLSDTFADEPVVEALLRDRIGQAYHAIGVFPKALEHFETAVTLFHEERGVDDVESLSAMFNMAAVLRALGRLDEAAVMHREVLETRMRTRGEDHPDTLRSMASLAIAYRQLGQLDEAEELAKKALDGRVRVLGEEHPETLASLNNAAGVLRMRGRGGDAAAMYQRALDARRRVLGPDDRDTLAILSNLASLLPQLGRFDEAEQLYAELLERRQRVLGAHHPDTLRVYNNVANLHLQRGDLETAEHYLSIAVERRIAALGVDHPDTLHSIGNLAHLFRQIGRLDEAEKYSRQALLGLEQRLGPTHQRVLVTKGNLGAILLDQGRIEEAEPLYRAALVGFTETLGENHRFTIIATNELGHLLMAKEAYEDAASMYRRAGEDAARAFPPAHPQQWLSRADHGLALARLGRYDEAAVVLADALAGLTAAVGAAHPDAMAVARELDSIHAQRESDTVTPAAGEVR